MSGRSDDTEHRMQVLYDYYVSVLETSGIEVDQWEGIDPVHREAWLVAMTLFESDEQAGVL